MSMYELLYNYLQFWNQSHSDLKTKQLWLSIKKLGSILSGKQNFRTNTKVGRKKKSNKISILVRSLN